MSSYSSYSSSSSPAGGGYQPPQHHHAPQPVAHSAAAAPVSAQSASASSVPAASSSSSSASSSSSVLTWQTPPLPAASSSNPFVSDGKQQAELPSPRTYFSMLEYRQRLYLFGGFGDSKGRFNDLHVYEEGRGWRQQETRGECPKPIYLHTACLLNGKMIVYGGNIGKDSNDMFTLDLDTLVWTRIPVPTPAPAAVSPPNPFAPPAPPSSAPSPRYGHACCINKEQLVIVGGCRQNSLYFQDSYAFTFATGSWRRLGDVPIDLAYHSLWSYNGAVYLFGGYNGVKFGEHLYCLDASTSLWLPVRVSGVVPPPCCGAAVSVLGRHVYVFGGYTQAGHTNLLYRIDMSTRVWELLNTNNKPLPRAYLQSAVINGNMYVFGGYDGSKCVTDFKMLRIAPALPAVAAPPAAQPPAPYSRPALPAIQPPAPSIPVSANSSSPMNALFAGLNVAQPASTNHHSHAAASSSSSSSSPSLPSSASAPSLASVLREGKLEAQVDFVLKQFGAGKQYLERKDVEALMMNLSLHAPAPQPPPPASAPHVQRPGLHHSSSASAASASRFPYTPSSFSSSSSAHAGHPRLQDIIDIGFTRAHVLQTLDLMTREQQDTNNFELVVDRCLKEQDRQQSSQQQQNGGGGGIPGGSSVELTAQLHSALAEKEEVRQCSICFDRTMDCVLLDCGHLLCCMHCGKGLIRQMLPCPVCRKNIRGTMKIYWN